MTDARLRGEWFTSMRMDDLSDNAWRVFTRALMWSNENGTNGYIPQRYLRYMHPDGHQLDAYAELQRAGLWAREEEGFQFLDWDGALGQSTAEQVEAYKENGRKRARAYRERQRSKLDRQVGSSGSTSFSVTGDVTRDVRENVGIGIGEGEGEGQELEAGSSAEITNLNSRTGEVGSSWSTRIPGTDRWAEGA